MKEERALFGLPEAALREFIRSATDAGYVTCDQVDVFLAQNNVKSEQIEDILAKFADIGVRIVENGSDADIETKALQIADEKAPEELEAEDQPAIVWQRALSTTQASKGPQERTDDPLRIYLRDMGSTELLSREGEVAIAKRIEAGRETMMAGLCESPLTFQAISIWRDEICDGKVLLREVIDLDATNSDRAAKPANDTEHKTILDRLPSRPGRPPDTSPFGFQSELSQPTSDGTEAGYEVVSESDVNEDEAQNWLSIGALEAELKPRALETLR